MKTSILTGLCLSCLSYLAPASFNSSTNTGPTQQTQSNSLVTPAIGSVPPARLNDTIPAATDTTLHQFEKVEIEASFRGGEEQWRKFIGANLNPEVPIKKKAPVGTYTVKIQFVVLKDGRVGEFKAQTQWGYGMEEEVIRVLSASPRWKPATQDGKAVNAFRIQPVTFEVVGKKKKKSDD